MKNTYTLIAILSFFLLFTNCDFEEESTDFYEPQFTEAPVNKNSIIPQSTAGRANSRQGCVETNSRTATISLWDHGTIDGDIVSLYLNGKLIVSQVTLDGPNNKYTVNVTLENNGFNYVTLYAHNLGDIAPNTAAISINGEQFTLESNLETNGAFDVVVTGYGVTCSNGGNSGGGGNSGTSNGKVAFYTTSDLGCGNISITVNGNGTKTLTQYFPQGIANCSQGVVFSLSPGTYSYKATCSKYTWQDSFTISQNGCLRYKLQ